MLVLIALLVALFVSGVLGGDEPASSPRISAPVAAPDDTTTPEIVLVPGAKDATGVEVERAKARDRARRRGETLPADRGDAPTATKRKPAATPASGTPSRQPAATAAPRTAPAPPPPPPAKKTATATEKRIDAGNGATGAEQVPPPVDSSKVPELAPPP